MPLSLRGEPVWLAHQSCLVTLSCQEPWCLVVLPMPGAFTSTTTPSASVGNGPLLNVKYIGRPVLLRCEGPHALSVSSLGVCHGKQDAPSLLTTVHLVSAYAASVYSRHYRQ